MFFTIQCWELPSITILLFLIIIFSCLATSFPNLSTHLSFTYARVTSGQFSLRCHKKQVWFIQDRRMKREIKGWWRGDERVQQCTWPASHLSNCSVCQRKRVLSVSSLGWLHVIYLLFHHSVSFSWTLVFTILSLLSHSCFSGVFFTFLTLCDTFLRPEKWNV